jgi:hypothetical protein
MRFTGNVRPVTKVPQVRARLLGANLGEVIRDLLGQAKFASCLGALLLTLSFAQSSAQISPAQSPYAPPPPPQQQRPPSQHADGQWHYFQKNRPSPSSPYQARPRQNQPGHAGNWLRRYKDLPPAQQRRALENDPQFRRLPPQQQARLQKRLQHFSSLPPQQQERVLNRMETWEHLTPYQKQQARQLFQQFKQLPPDRRQALNRAIRSMRGLTPQQRDQLINSDQYKSAFTPQERGLLAGASRLPLAPGDGLNAQPPEE